MIGLPRFSGPMLGACSRRWTPVYIAEPIVPPPTPGPGPGPRPGIGPVWVADPELTSLAIVGRPTTYSTGSYTAAETITKYLQWTIDGVDIPGATHATYTPKPSDYSKHLALKEIAYTGVGPSYTAYSKPQVVIAVPATSVPASPTNVTAVPQSAGQVLVSWTPPLTNSDGSPALAISSYIVYHGSASGQSKPGGSGVTSQSVIPINNEATIVGISAGVIYFAVTAVNAAGEGWESPEVAATVT